MPDPAVVALAEALADRYRLERELGRGGMATVWLARDLKHGREVALKVLRPELAVVLGAERFLQEITTTANLQHPHILPLFDSGEVAGQLFYAMPYVQGESLRDRLRREKQLPIADAVRIGSEVASALDYAHRRGVIHRDIKPENILLHDGQALVADFGIALAASKAGGARMTETGLSLGTPQYMSPEQATADPELDARSDIYALGAVTYEMLTGEPPFSGPTTQAIVAKLLSETPRPPSVLRRRVPVAVEGAVLTALEKLPADRFDGAAAFAAALRGETVPRHGPTGDARARRQHRILLAGGWGTAAVLAALLAMTAARRARPGASAGGSDVRRFTITLPDSAPLAVGTNRPALALTPDGGSLVYVARIHGEHRVMVKDLRSDSVRALAGGIGGTGPFIDPAGRAAGFFVGWDLVVSPIAGGSSRRLDAVTPVTRGASWISDSTVAVATDPNSGVAEIPRGLHPDWSHTLAGDSQHAGPQLSRAWPEMLASEGVLLSARSTAADADQWEILARDLARGTERVIVEGGSNPRYAASGHILYVRENGIWAVPFDRARLAASGRPTLVQPAVMTELDGLAHYAVAANGTMVYAAGGEWRSTRRLVWVSPDGTLEPLHLPLGTYNGLALAPDGRRVALTRGIGSNYDVWVGDLVRGTVLPVTRDPGEDGAPIWAPDGRRLAIGTESRYGGPPKLALLELGTGVLRIEGDSGREFGAPTGWSRDGGLVFFESRQVGVGAAKLGKDISVLNLATRRRRLWLQTPDNEHSAVPSPDGTLVAYVSDESGQQEVYLRALGGGTAPLPVSSGGGREPHWAAAGRTLFFRQGDRVLSVRVAGDPKAPDLSPAVTAFRLPASLVTDAGFTSAAWDLAPDGHRLLAIDDVARVQVTTLHVVLNLFDELLRRAPADR